MHSCEHSWVSSLCDQAAYVLQLMVSSSLKHLSLPSVESVPQNEGMRCSHPCGTLSEGLDALLCAQGTLSFIGISMFINGHLTYICIINK